MPMSANPRIRPADPIHHLSSSSSSFSSSSSRSRGPTSSASQKGPRLTRERSDGRIETRCTATTMIIDTRVLKSDLGGRMFTRMFCVIPCRLTHVRGTIVTTQDLFINFKALDDRLYVIIILSERARDFDLVYIFFNYKNSLKRQSTLYICNWN